MVVRTSTRKGTINSADNRRGLGRVEEIQEMRRRNHVRHHARVITKQKTARRRKGSEADGVALAHVQSLQPAVGQSKVQVRRRKLEKIKDSADHRRMVGPIPIYYTQSSASHATVS